MSDLSMRVPELFFTYLLMAASLGTMGASLYVVIIFTIQMPELDITGLYCYLGIAFVVLGFLTFLCCQWGTIAILDYHRRWFIMYLILLACICVLAALGFEATFLFHDMMVRELNVTLLQLFTEEYSVEHFEDSTEIVDKIQSTMQCCGVFEYTDWEEAMFHTLAIEAERKEAVPSSCCIEETEGCSIGEPGRPMHLKNIYYETPCMEAVTNYLQTHLYVLSSLAVVTAFLSLFALVWGVALRLDITSQPNHIKETAFDRFFRKRGYVTRIEDGVKRRSKIGKKDKKKDKPKEKAVKQKEKEGRQKEKKVQLEEAVTPASDKDETIPDERLIRKIPDYGSGGDLIPVSNPRGEVATMFWHLTRPGASTRV